MSGALGACCSVHTRNSWTTADIYPTHSQKFRLITTTFVHRPETPQLKWSCVSRGSFFVYAMAPGASTLRLCLRTSLRHPSLPNVSIRPSRARAVNITASRKLSISAPRRALEDEDVGPTPQIHDIRRKFDRFRAERERDEKPLTQINQVQLDKLEQDMIEETRMWPIINYDPAKDPDREFTRRKFQKNLQEMGRKFTESELDAIMMGPLRATPTIKHKGRMPADALEPTETEGITPGKWEEDRDRFLPNPASLTYREIREVLSGVVDGDSNDWTKPEEPRLDRKSYWNDEDDDDPQTHDVDGWDTFDEDDILSVAHGKLDELREHRHYARLAAWELPLLSSKFVWLQCAENTTV